MLKICSVIGARPQFIKASPLSSALKDNFHEIMINTGQHYDHEMSATFFEELSLPEPNYNLEIGSGKHGEQTAAMLSSMEEIFIKENPDAVMVYGDTNSTIAGALAAAKLHIPVIHVEAGLRSYNKRMPEEINRIVTDHVSDFLFVPSETSKKNLLKEGIIKGVHVVGDIMYDSILMHGPRAREKSNILSKLKIKNENYYLATIHRAENTDTESRLQSIFESFSKIKATLILPLHPRTKKYINKYSLIPADNIKIIDPVGYLDMLRLMQQSSAVLTDSGGVQKEAYYLKVPCITLRSETEWIETVEVGWNKVVDADPAEILKAVNNSEKVKERSHTELYGDGDTAKQIVDTLISGL